MICTRWMLLCLFVCLLQQAQSQKYNDMMPFGNHSGLDLTGSQPYLMDTSAIQRELVRGKYTYAASICNKYGDLLLYTDGFTVWNRHHQEIPKFESKWCWTEHVIPLICPYPGNDSMYYIFGVSNGSYAYQLQYLSVKALPNGSRAEIIYPRPSTFSNYYTILKKDASLYVAGTLHCNRHDYWIVTHSNDAFYNYLVTDAGVSTTPVVTPIDPAIMGAASYDDINIKFSANGERLLIPLTKQRKVIVYKFNNLTGSFSDPVVIKMKNDDQLTDAELSPDGTKLYIAWYLQHEAGGEVHNIAQYNLDAGSATQIENSFYGIVNDSVRTNFCTQYVCFHQKRTMELAADGNIYVSEEYKTFPLNPELPTDYFLGRISNPNQAGKTAKYRYNLLESNANNPLYIKYNYIRSTAFSVKENGIQFEDNICNSTPVKFSLLFRDIDSVRWDLGDPASGENNRSSLLNPQHIYPSPGNYQVKAYIYTRCFIDTAITSVNITEKPGVMLPVFNDTTLCVGKTLLLDATSNWVDYYKWNTNNTGPIQEISKAGTYWVTAGNQCNTDTSKFTITYDSCNCRAYVPNAFTPNMDQLNDIFRPIVNCNGLSQSSNYLFRVFNRWGAVVYTSTKPGEGWNGRYHEEPVETGSYKWMLQYINPNSGQVEKQYGTVLLLR